MILIFKQRNFHDKKKFLEAFLKLAKLMILDTLGSKLEFHRTIEDYYYLFMHCFIEIPHVEKANFNILSETFYVLLIYFFSTIVIGELP